MYLNKTGRLSKNKIGQLLLVGCLEGLHDTDEAVIPG